jgi:hypothetical protein
MPERGLKLGLEVVAQLMTLDRFRAREWFVFQIKYRRVMGYEQTRVPLQPRSLDVTGFRLLRNKAVVFMRPDHIPSHGECEELCDTPGAQFFHSQGLRLRI